MTSPTCLSNEVEDLIRDLDIMFYHHDDLVKVATEDNFNDEKLSPGFSKTHSAAFAEPKEQQY